MKTLAETGYNERLFEGGGRRRFHLARFEWVKGALSRVSALCDSVLELGCFDGRAVDYLPRTPGFYLGLDANWERGLEVGTAKYARDQRFEFRRCTTPNELRASCKGRLFDTALCLETLEHVPVSMLEDYVRSISEVVTGHIAVTVPNEKGLVFLAKYVVKRACRVAPTYRGAEIMWATLGRMSSLARNEHKGFDYESVIAAVSRYFEVLEVTGYPFRSLPRSTGFGVGILARARASMTLRPASACSGGASLAAAAEAGLAGEGMCSGCPVM